MEEKELIKQIKDLNRIKPNKHWVSLTKQTVFGKEQTSPSWFFIPLGRPAFALASLALAATFIFGGLVLFMPQRMPVASLNNFQALVSKFALENEANVKALASLEAIQGQLENIGTSLDDLKNSKNPAYVLTMTEIVKGTAKRSEEAVWTIKNIGDLSSQVRTSLSEVAEASRVIEEKTTTLQKETFDKYFQELKTRPLVGEDLDNFNKAKEYYAQGLFSEAVIFITKIQ